MNVGFPLSPICVPITPVNALILCESLILDPPARGCERRNADDTGGATQGTG